MPDCDARYDVIYGPPDGSVPDCTSPATRAVVDMVEDRLPDAWGEPGRLVSARLARWWARNARSISYGVAAGRGPRLWVDGRPRKTYGDRRYLRWAWIEPDPPVDPVFDDPA